MATHGRPKDGVDRDKRNKQSGYSKPGGNMGAGQSGSESLGSEKPTDDEALGSQKPTRPRKKKSPSAERL